MFPNRIPQRRPETRNPDECQIEVKKSKTGTKIRFRGKCSREMVEYAKNQANDLPEGGTKIVKDFD